MEKNSFLNFLPAPTPLLKIMNGETEIIFKIIKEVVFNCYMSELPPLLPSESDM